MADFRNSHTPVHLEPWRDSWGRSEGWFMVSEVPGLCVYKMEQGWMMEPLEAEKIAPCFNFPEEAKRVWGADADLTSAQQVMERNTALLLRVFQSPEQAALELGSALPTQERS